jgi:hypothetical protein
MRPRAFSAAYILAAFFHPAAAEIEPRFLTAKIVQSSPPVLELEIPAELRDRWVRLRNHRGRVAVNGTTVAPRAADRVTSTVALSPYLILSGTNRIELDSPRAGEPRVELTPRVFLAAAALRPGSLRILVENTLENAANVQVDVPGLEPRNAYVPPESQIEIEFPVRVEPSAEIRLAKFPEALEDGYSTRGKVSSLATIELRETAKGAMVLGRVPEPYPFHILERWRPERRPRGWE